MKEIESTRCRGSMLRCVRTWAAIPKLETNHPKVLSQKYYVKVFILNIFFGSERVPPISLLDSCFSQTFLDLEKALKEIESTRCRGSMLRCVRTWAAIPKLETNHPKVLSQKYYVKVFILNIFSARKGYPP